MNGGLGSNHCDCRCTDPFTVLTLIEPPPGPMTPVKLWPEGPLTSIGRSQEIWPLTVEMWTLALTSFGNTIATDPLTVETSQMRIGIKFFNRGMDRSIDRCELSFAQAGRVDCAVDGAGIDRAMGALKRYACVDSLDLLEPGVGGDH